MFIICYFSARFFSSAEPTIRLTGMTLQLLGFFMSLWQLLELRKRLKLPNLLQGIRNYFNNFPKFNQRISISGGIAGISMVGKVNVSIIRNPKTKLSEKVAQLGRDFERIEARLNELEDKHSLEINSLKKSMSDELQRLDAGIKDIENSVDDLFGGGTTLQFVGVVYFVIGLILASASVEISYMIQLLK